MNKRLVVDARMINSSGIGVYICKYLNFIIQTSSYKLTLLGDEIKIKKHLSNVDLVQIINTDIPIYSIKEQLVLPFLIPECDIYWSPNYNVPVFLTRAKKILVTMPDTAHLSFANEMGFGVLKKIYSRLVFFLASIRASQIVTISDFSKTEILKHLKINESKIDIIYLGIDNVLFRNISTAYVLEQIKVRYRLPNNFILFVGNVKPHKNLKALVMAFEILIKKDPSLYLVIVGKKEGFITGDISLFDYIDSKNDLSNRIKFTGYVEESDLPTLYSLATVFAFPSLYEGFGFPPLEAMASGCAVIASNAASIPEICGDNVIYFDPKSIESIGIGLEQMLYDKQKRDIYIQKGLKHVRKFDWAVSSASFMDVINKL